MGAAAGLRMREALGGRCALKRRVGGRLGCRLRWMVHCCVVPEGTEGWRKVVDFTAVQRTMRRDRTEVSSLSTALLWLFEVNLGIAMGAGLYEARIVIPDWIDPRSTSPDWNAAAARHDDTGMRFWVGVTTVPLTLLTLANLFAGSRARGRLRRWWLAAATTALVERGMTLGYFIPTMVGLMQSENSPETVATAIRWTQLNNVRHLLTAGALLATMKAISLRYAQDGGRGRR